MNLPNKLSILRIILVPLMVFFYLATFIPAGKIIALIIFILAALTDMLDGKIARKYNLVTDLGKLLDPIADKLLVLGALLLIIVDGTIPSPYSVIGALLVIGRDFIVSALRQVAASKNVVLAADKWGKIKAIVLDAALPMLMLLSYLSIDLNMYGGYTEALRIACYVVFGLGTLLTVYSGINYMVKNAYVFKDDSKSNVQQDENVN